MALVTILGTWGSAGHKDILRLDFGDWRAGLMLRASKNIAVEVTSLWEGGSATKDASELVVDVGEVDGGYRRLRWIVLVGVVGTGVPQPDLTRG